ncbi:MAG: hypothetical protein U0L34_04465, partial [Paludibacteraceae bacterium]|nr:hypothetical protein [Paludibacteraceae bacterium]
IKANATTTDATATVKVDKASEVSVNNVQASVTATVNALPSAAFDITSSTICIDEQDKELTNIKVNFTGAAPFDITYHDAAGNTYVENNLPASALLLNQSLDGDESYTLKSVTDANGCTGTITNQSHTVTTQTHASLGALTAPEGVCNGGVLTLTAPDVTNNKGAVVTNPKWFLDGQEFDPATSVTHDEHNGKPLYYQITSSCNGKERDITTTPAVNVTVHALPSAAFDAASSTICIDEQDKELTNIKVNFTGAAPFDITYQVDQNAAVIKNDVPNPYYIKETLTGNSTITLLSVVDNNGCDVTPTANQTHTVTTKTHASLGALTTPPAVCEGGVLALTAPTVTNNKDAVVTNPTWFLDGKAFDPATTVTNAQHDGKPLY